MKTLKNVDAVQLAGLAGSMLTIVATMLTGFSNEKKFDAKIDEKVAEAIAKQLGNTHSNE
jgi:hypothetical protein